MRELSSEHNWLTMLLRSLYLCTTLAGINAWTAMVFADVQYEQISTVELPKEPKPHWVWVNDASYERIEAGRATLVDGDTGKYLGWLSTGVFFMTLTLPSDYHSIYSVETYYSRGVRGKRTDVVRIYDTRTLQPNGEIPIPPKRGAGVPTLFHTSLTDDNHFLLIYNYTPSQSVSVVDIETRSLVGEIETPGCVLAYPDSPHLFHMLCGDGSILLVELHDSGLLKQKSRVKGFFDPQLDPIQEDAARVGKHWIYVSYGGFVYSVDVESSQPQLESPWSLLNKEERSQSWRTGGMQLISAHEENGYIYVLMHQGNEISQEQAGTEVWVYSLETQRRVQRIKLRMPALSIQVSQDTQPLLFAVAFGSELDIYDAREGTHLRTVKNVAANSSVLQVPWKH